MKWLIVTGGDFGASCGINRGIVQAHREGILTAASLLVNWPASEEAATLGRECPTLSLGLHLELDADDPERVPAQLERQLARFQELAGAALTHVDSHHDVHHDRECCPTSSRGPGPPGCRCGVTPGFAISGSSTAGRSVSSAFVISGGLKDFEE